MAVRMYALAKELNLDSKVLVDLCTKAGVPGKGSALASLTEEEVVKVKEYIAGRDKPRRPATPTPVPAVAAAPKPSRLAEPAAVATVAKPAAKAPEPAVIRREDYVGTGGITGRPPLLGDRSKKPPITLPTKRTAEEQREAAELRRDDEGGAPSPKPAPRPNPTIHLAPMPAAQQPRTPSKPDEPAPQKPIIALTPDVIRSAKTGSRPLAGHLQRVEAQNKLDAKKPGGKVGGAGKDSPGGRRGGPTAEPAAAPLESPLRGKGRRGAKTPERGEEETEGKTLLGGREQRQLSRKSRGKPGGEDEASPRRAKRKQRSGPRRMTALPRKGNISVTLPCTVRTLSEAIGVPAAKILSILLREGIMGTITAQVEPEMAEFIASELGVEVEFKQQVSLEDQVLASLRDREDAPEDLQTRPPVITFLGHVDHGKTSLLDRIIGINVASGESGGITQHIRAYQIERGGFKISFVDTPGHEAFTEMRARGANVTDIAVLVVAADDGVMPQTEEAISHARAAEVPIVVALNKIDLPGIDTNRVYQGLTANDLLPSEWGGDIEVVKTSAQTGVGIDELLDTLLTVAELHDLKSNPNRAAHGTCLESQQDQGRGVLAKIIVQGGTLKVGDIVVCGQAYGRVKAMYDTLEPNKKIEAAGPSTPVNLTGLNIAPQAGQHFYVLEDIVEARELAESRAAESRAESLSGGPSHVTLETLFDRLGGEGDVSTLNIILRADTRGSIEAIRKELTKLEHDEVKIKILQATVGGVTEADVHLAHASDAIILAFNVVPDEAARGLADRTGVQVRRYDIIYKVTEDLRAALEGMLKPEEKEIELGRALVQQTFVVSRFGTIAGCRVLAGTIERNSRIRVIRNNTIIGDYPLGSLRRIKDDVREVREGMECGMKLDGFNDLKEGDILEAYRIEQVGRKFDE